jgi:hypothetical protein
MHLNKVLVFFQCDELVTKGMMAGSATFFSRGLTEGARIQETPDTYENGKVAGGTARFLDLLSSRFKCRLRFWKRKSDHKQTV